MADPNLRSDPMGEAKMFGEGVTRDEAEKAVGAARLAGPAKLLRAAGNQILLMPTDLEALCIAFWSAIACNTLKLLALVRPLSDRPKAAGGRR